MRLTWLAVNVQKLKTMVKPLNTAKFHWFKFEPDEWLFGDITTLQFDIQGVFINLCVFYWTKAGNVKTTSAKRRYGADKIDILLEHDIIKEQDGYLAISFLDSQIENCQDKTQKYRENANKRWSNSNATVMQLHSNSNATAIQSKSKSKSKSKIESKNINTNKIDKVADATTIKKRKESEFYKSLVQFIPEFGKETVREFYDYWSESSPRAKQLRFEKEKTFDPAKRILRWSKYGSNRNNSKQIRSTAKVDTSNGPGEL